MTTDHDPNLAKGPELADTLPTVLGPYRFPTREGARRAAFDLMSAPNAAALERAVYGNAHVFGDRFVGYVEQQPGKFVSAESAIGVDTVLLRETDPVTKEERAVERNVLKKSIIKTDPHGAAKEQTARLLHLRECGIPVADIYALKDGTIYEECLKKSDVDPLADIRGERGEWERHLAQLCAIAATLDRNGYRTLHFIEDLVFDGRTFKYVDGGSDLGEPDKEETTHALRTLCKTFPRQEERIRKEYAAQLSLTRRMEKRATDAYFTHPIAQEKFDVPGQAA